jgi:hypothetical protein
MHEASHAAVQAPEACFEHLLTATGAIASVAVLAGAVVPLRGVDAVGISTAASVVDAAVHHG